MTEKLEWNDISNELYRVYTFPNGEVVRIDKPLRIAVSQRGHRIETQDRVGHYVPLGWIHIEWVVKDGTPVFVF